MFRLCSAFLALFGLMSAPLLAEDGNSVKLYSEPAYSVMTKGEKGAAYLRVKVAGMPFKSEGERTPVNVALVIDKSGSMQGEKIEQAKDAALAALNRLASRDVIAVVAFNHTIERIVPGGPYENVPEMRRRIETLRADGQTAIYAAVTQGAAELREFMGEGRFNRVILLSDGQANVGPSQPRDLEQLGRELGGKGISVTTLGLGLGYNEDLMLRLASASDGNHAFVEHPDQLVEIFNREFGDILSVVAQDVEIIIECPEGVKPLRSLGREATIEGQRVRLALSQIYGEQDKYAVLELDVSDKAAAAASARLASVKVRYFDPRSKRAVTIDGEASVSFSASKDEVARSVNPDVLAAVTTQIATERNEAAVALRDAGKVEEARKLLESNAAYIREQAEAIGPAPGSASLKALSDRNAEDAKALDGGDWEKQRKIMRHRQHKDKTQQMY